MSALRRAADRYLRLLHAGTFSSDETGARVFFPSGILGRGYVVTGEQEAAIRRFLARFYVVVFVVAIVGAQPLGLGALLVIPPLLAAYWVWSRRVVAGLPVSPLRMTSREAGRRAVGIIGRRWLIVLLVISVVMTAASIGMVLSPNYRLVGFLGVLLFGFASFRNLSLLVRYRHEPSQPTEPPA
jgi:hypothetical protein